MQKTQRILLLYLSNIILAILFISIASNNISALGVSPGRVEVDFVPKGEFSMQTCFTQYTTRYLKIEPLGFVADHITIKKGVDKDNILDTSTTNGCLEYDIILPQSFEKPGIQYGGLSATELPEDTGGNIYAVVKIIHQIYVKVPYPGKYLEVGISAQNKPAGDVVPITISLESKGIETINSASGVVTIYDSKDNLLATINTDNAALIKTNERRQLEVKWNSTTNKEGNYKAKIQLTYDKLNNNASTNFKLGGLDLNVVGYTKELIIGGISRFVVEIDSIWSETIPNAKATVYVFNKDNTVLQQFDTLTGSVPAWSKIPLLGYIDTQQLGLGNFSIQINLSFANTTKEHDGQISIIEPKKPEPDNQEKGKFASTPLLLGLIGIITATILAIVIFVLIKKDKKKDQPDNTNKSQDIK